MINLDVLKAQEVLVRYADDFLDIDFDDVLHDVRRYVLSEEECTYIMKPTSAANNDPHVGSASHNDYPTHNIGSTTSNSSVGSPPELIDKLLFVLSTSSHRLGRFIDAIEEKYDWLAKRMRRALLDNSKDDELEAIRQQIQELRNQIPRLEALNVQRKHFVSVAIRRIRKSLDTN